MGEGCAVILNRVSRAKVYKAITELFEKSFSRLHVYVLSPWYILANTSPTECLCSKGVQQP